MKRFFPLAVLASFLSPVAFAAGSKTTFDHEMDLSLVCEMHKLALKLGRSEPFKHNVPELAVRASEMVQAGIKTPEVKKAYAAIAMADPKEREELWKKVAADAGIAKWRCPELKRKN